MLIVVQTTVHSSLISMFWAKKSLFSLFQEHQTPAFYTWHAYFYLYFPLFQPPFFYHFLEQKRLLPCVAMFVLLKSKIVKQQMHQTKYRRIVLWHKIAPDITGIVGRNINWMIMQGIMQQQRLRAMAGRSYKSPQPKTTLWVNVWEGVRPTGAKANVMHRQTIAFVLTGRSYFNAPQPQGVALSYTLIGLSARLFRVQTLHTKIVMYAHRSCIEE